MQHSSFYYAGGFNGMSLKGENDIQDVEKTRKGRENKSGETYVLNTPTNLLDWDASGNKSTKGYENTSSQLIPKTSGKKEDNSILQKITYEVIMDI